MSTWIDAAVDAIRCQRIEHANYQRAVGSAFNALAVAQPGEVVPLIGPSRVGKSAAIRDAMRMLAGPISLESDTLPYVVVEAENASTDGSFSTKSFMRQACEAIRHPIYGVAAPDDPMGYRLDVRIHRTPEGMLRNAFERAIGVRFTRYLVIDEAHHVTYVSRRAGGAVAVLDSWKCLAQKTGLILVLVGPYQLLEVMNQAPHLLGRQRPIEFPRYRAVNAEDRRAFNQVLKAWSVPLHFEDDTRSLLAWANPLFEHAFGCVGHLSRWLRAALGSMKEAGESAITRVALNRTQMPISQEMAIESEILRGEQVMAGAEVRAAALPSETSKRGSRKPFQRATRRFPLEGRS